MYQKKWLVSNIKNINSFEKKKIRKNILNRLIILGQLKNNKINKQYTISFINIMK